jgi:hypothetical protein
MYAVTDYFAQGETFSAQQSWLVDMRPPTGQLHRASLYVMLTRFRTFAQLRLLCPLWPPGDAAAERRVKARFLTALQPDLDLRAEWRRLTRLAEASHDWCAKETVRLRQLRQCTAAERHGYAVRLCIGGEEE